jgi:DNA-binding transcriptional MerR regulator
MTSNHLTIGEAARETGLTVKAIRFYERRGYVSATSRTDAGYRLYDRISLNRLRLIRRARQLGMPLPEVGSLLRQASGDCGEMVGHLTYLVANQRRAINERIAELEALRTDLDTVEAHLRHCQCAPGVRVDDCDYCLLPERKEVMQMEDATAETEDTIELVDAAQASACDCDCCPECPPDCC